MTDFINVCAACAAVVSSGKFCVECGSKLEVATVDASHAARFRNYLLSVVADGADLCSASTGLIEEAVDLGIPQAYAQRLLSEVASVASDVPVRLSYNASLAREGIARGSTMLSIRVENVMGKGLSLVSIVFAHPETGRAQQITNVANLMSGRSRVVPTTLRIESVGHQVIHVGEVRVETMQGHVRVFRFASEILLSTENADVTKVIHNTQHFSQQISTHGGGVIDASGFSSSGFNDSTPTTSLSPSGKDDEWLTIRLLQVGTADSCPLGLESSLFGQRDGRGAGEADSHNKQLSPDVLKDSVVTDLSERVSSAAAENLANAMSTADSSNRIGLSEDSASQPGGEKYRVDSFKFATTDEISRVAVERGADAGRRFALAEVVRLIDFASKLQARSTSSIFRPEDVELGLLTRIAETSKVKRGDVLGVAVSHMGSNHPELRAILGYATVITLRGPVVLEQSGDNLMVSDRYSWGFLAENGWGPYRQVFGKGKFILSFGDEANDSCLPGLNLDLRKSSDGEAADVLFDRLRFAYGFVLRPDEPAQVSTSDSGARPAESAVDSTTLLDAPVKQEEYVDEDEGEPDELESAVSAFFRLFAFASQCCDEQADRPVHFFVPREGGGDIDLDLARSVQRLFPHSQLIAIGEEDAHSQHKHDERRRLLSWSGTGSVITRDGIFHVNSEGGRTFTLHPEKAFLSWSRFFEMGGNLIVRWQVPDLWLGTGQAVLISGTYVDYTSRIDRFIQFESTLHSELRERLTRLRATVSALAVAA